MLYSNSTVARSFGNRFCNACVMVFTRSESMPNDSYVVSGSSSAGFCRKMSPICSCNHGRRSCWIFRSGLAAATGSWRGDGADDQCGVASKG